MKYLRIKNVNIWDQHQRINPKKGWFKRIYSLQKYKEKNNV